MTNDCGWTDAQNSACTLYSRTVHSHIDNALMSIWFVGVVDEIELEVPSAVATQLAL